MSQHSTIPPPDSPAPLATPQTSKTIEIQVEDTDDRQESASTVPFTPETYAQRVSSHRRSSAGTSLYAGGDFTSLAKFLLSPQQKKSRAAATLPPSPFAYLYDLDSQSGPLATRLDWPQAERGKKHGTNQLLFLTGYPCAQWLNRLGYHYGIDPEFYHRHMDFIRPRFIGPAPSLVLPSSTSRIFELRYVSLGVEENRIGEGLAKMQKESDKQMHQYFQGLKNGGAWKPEHSIVRSYCVHGNDTFSIEQKLTVYTAKQRLDTDHWIVIVWLDSGDILADSPTGPWCSTNGEPQQHRFHPSGMYKPGIALTEHRVTDEAAERNPYRLEQSVRLLPRFYGKSLQAEEMSSDLFYALNEIFAFVVYSELSFLRTISLDLDADFDEAEEKLGQGCCHLTLMHYQQLLERQNRRTRETLDFIQNRHILGFPKPDKPTPSAAKAEASLKLDFEYLLREGKRLQKRCKSNLEYRKSQIKPTPSTPSVAISSHEHTWKICFFGGMAIAFIVIFWLEIVDCRSNYLRSCCSPPETIYACWTLGISTSNNLIKVLLKVFAYGKK